MRKLSIAAVLITALVAIVTLLLGAFAAVVYHSERDQRVAQLRDTLTVSLDQQAAGLALPMWNLDETHVVAIMHSGMSNREVFAIAASTPDKKYVLARDARWQVDRVDAEPTAKGLIVEERTVRHSGEPVGSVRVFASPRFLEEELSDRRAAIVVFILVLDVMLVLSMTLLLWQLMLKPVSAMEHFAASVKAGSKPGAGLGKAWFYGELKTLNQSIRDMTAMLDSRYRALCDSEERLKLATRAANIGIWDWDVVKNELVWDEEMYRLYGIRREDFGGTCQSWANTRAADDFKRSTEEIEAVLRREPEHEAEFTIRRPDGAVRILKGEATTIRDETGRVIRKVGVNFDITEGKQAEAQIKKLNAELEHRVRERTAQLEAAVADLARARDEAESATRAKSEFLANMSHEIRTPMNAILGMANLALRTEMTAKQRDYLTKAKAAAGSLLLIIDDILDFSKIEAGKLDMESREFTLAAVLDKVTAVVGVKAHEKGLELLLNTAADVPPALVGDPLRLEQVLINLCSNAVKFTASGEIVVVTMKGLVAAENRVTLRFAVRDTGVGMTGQQIKGLFQPFSQLDASTTRVHGGTGLGLAICKKLVTLMGGEIGVTSQPGKGSDFHFTASFGIGRAASEAARGAEAGLTGLRILVVDDSANSRDIFAGLLTGLGYAPVMVSSAADGLVELQRAPHDAPYDLVFLDWKMPQMDGFAAAAAIRRMTDLPRAPKLIMITAYGDDELMRRAVAQELDGCLTRPVSASTLLDAIMTACAADADSRASVEALSQPTVTSRAPACLEGRRVLLVEDNEFNRIIATELLGDVAGAIVTVAGNGEEAVERVRAEDFDAVLMDVQMPLMDGYQATALIRQDAAHASLPIIAMTAHAMVRDREKCLAVGMNDYVTKPFEPTELFAVLAKWVGPHGPDRAGEPAAPGMSFELGLQRCLGRVDLYERILSRYLATRLDAPSQIRAALEERDLDKASGFAHSLISTAGTIGAEALSEAARAVQLAIDAGEDHRWPALIDALAQHHAIVATALENYFAGKSEGFRAANPAGR